MRIANEDIEKAVEQVIKDNNGHEMCDIFRALYLKGFEDGFIRGEAHMSKKEFDSHREYPN